MSVAKVTIPDVNCGEYLIIRADGSETLVKEKPTIKDLETAIGCDVMDSVFMSFDGEKRNVMMLDDNSMASRKPVNEKATALYLMCCRPGTKWEIKGTVVIVNDEDFD